MKKAITILAIIAIVACAVFADPVHDGATAIKVTTSVSNIEPVFVLKTTQIAASPASATSTINAGVQTKTAVATATATANALSGDDAHEITVNALLEGDVEVKFEILQNNATRAIKKYEFTATATDLNLYQYKNSAGVTVQNSGNTAHPAAAALKVFEVAEETVSTFTADDSELGDDQAEFGGTGEALTVKYLGTNADAGTKVAEFTCTWGQNEDAVVGDYQGTVTLTVATV